jgi:hypothetical protein
MKKIIISGSMVVLWLISAIGADCFRDMAKCNDWAYCWFQEAWFGLSIAFLLISIISAIFSVVLHIDS